MQQCPRTIVCPLFAAEAPSPALRCAAFFAKAAGSRLLIVYLARDIRSREHVGMPGAIVEPMVLTDTTNSSHLEGVDYQCFQLTGEHTSGLRNFVIENDADMVVLGNDVALEGSVSLGNLTRRLAETLPCAVVIVKTPNDRFYLDSSNDRAAEPFSNWLLGHN